VFQAFGTAFPCISKVRHACAGEQVVELPMLHPEKFVKAGHSPHCLRESFAMGLRVRAKHSLLSSRQSPTARMHASFV